MTPHPGHTGLPGHTGRPGAAARFAGRLPGAVAPPALGGRHAT